MARAPPYLVWDSLHCPKSTLQAVSSSMDSFPPHRWIDYLGIEKSGLIRGQTCHGPQVGSGSLTNPPHADLGKLLNTELMVLDHDIDGQ